ncbi:DNA polymerase III subunit beta [Candidatus Chloroploca sp. M-50]|uniref:Beta sliding clamp n=1 Tax=Candidatus Chloroploca mongolica TaxID=2528176 RepID=A0ABS4DA07_9CHLR|nr:DNA polymerase III subunit beta [Candidatus Chloroploca mongolica]MBP1466257.1 DNA polymerase III subunit beta [Candidatus Chloroploca mongolica]
MNLVIQQENLKHALVHVSRAVPGKAVIPVLSNVLLTTDQGRLRLSATDLNLAITVWVGAQITQDGSVLLPAGLFADLVAGLPNDAVTLAVNPDHHLVTVTAGRFSTELNGIAAEEFPTVPVTPPDGAPQVTFTAATLKAAIHQVACAAATTDTRPVLAGVAVRLQDAVATLTAADGIRLAVKQIALPEPVATPQEVIIPAPALRELGGLLSDTTAPVSMSLVPPATGSSAATQAIFTTDHFTLTTRLIDGQFPDVARILPKGCTTRAILEVRELNRAVKLAALIARVSQNVVKLSVSVDAATHAGTVMLSANAAGIGANTGAVEGQVTGEGGQIALNVTYLGDALAVIGTPQVAFEMVTAQAPGVLRPVGQNGYVHLIMPMALR